MNRNLPKMFSVTLILALLLSMVSTPSAFAAPEDDLVITGVIDGPLTGGIPKAVELYAVNAIADLSIYGLGSANNGGGTDGEEFTFPAVFVPAGTCIYVASESAGFNTFFGFNPDYTSGAVSINGDDAVELFANGSVSDVFGEINLSGTGQPWEYLDGWAYRQSATGPDGSAFVIGNWTFSGPNALDGETSNATAASPFPLGTYSPCAASESAPTVSNTTPANSTTNVMVDVDIDITFSEAVNVSGSWFDISCGTSGTHTATVSGGPTAFTLNPDVDFSNSETCTVTVFAAQVTDQDSDDPPDNMVADYAFSFDTVSPAPAIAIVINEILVDPDATSGDANGDGTVNTTQDEFVEIVNNESSSLDISGWTLSDGVGVRHTFPANTVIPASCSVVVFAGGTPTGAFGHSLVQVATGGQLGLNNGGDTVTLNNGTSDVTSYTYGTEGGENESLTRDPDVTGADPLVKHATATGSGGALHSPGTKIDGSQFAGCPADQKIHDVQGNGASSPLVGQTVIVEGIVVGDFQDGASGTNGDFNGFHIQEEDADADADPLTSEGIFVFDGSSPAVNVAVGDLVRVQGAVSEFNGLTEITSFTGVTVLNSGNPLPTATTLSLPVTAVSDFEAYEGMLVTFPQALYISEYFNYDRFGEIVLTSERHLTPTAEFEPGTDSIQAAQEFLLDKITLDDGRSNQNPDPAIHPNGNDFDLTNLFRGGDTVTNVTGVMDFSFSLYRIQPTQGADYTSANPRPATPDDVGGNLKVASFNVLNYFTTIDDGTNDICGPAGDQECRGADDAGELARQRAKIIAALTAIDADIVGLIEIENHPADVPTADLVSGLNDVFGAGTYDYIATGAIGTDAIRLAFIYKPATVTPVGAYAVLDTSVDLRFLDDFNRPVLAQTFEDNVTGGVVTVAVNHLKSKGSDCNDIGDPDTGDGSGNCNLTRKAAAEALVDWLATDPTGSGDNDFLIIGDLNSYDKEEPIDAIKAGSDDTAGTGDDYTDLVFQFQGEDAYSYVFDGQLGYLDHALANASLVGQVTGVTEWHINADEADLIDYDTSFKGPNQDAIYAPDAYRSSDHDPVIVGLNLTPPPPPLPQCNGQDATVYVDENGKIVGGPQNGQTYHGNLVGTHGNDVIVGTDAHNTIFAFGGNDVICALAGNDAVFGGFGNDVIEAGDGNDVVFGEFGNDTINGGDGKDSLFGGDGTDVLDGGADKDIVDGGLGNDTLSGNDGNDVVRGAQGFDVLNGGTGIDICNGGPGFDTSSGCELKIRIP